MARGVDCQKQSDERRTNQQQNKLRQRIDCRNCGAESQRYNQQQRHRCPEKRFAQEGGGINFGSAAFGFLFHTSSRCVAEVIVALDYCKCATACTTDSETKVACQRENNIDTMQNDDQLMMKMKRLGYKPCANWCQALRAKIKREDSGARRIQR